MVRAQKLLDIDPETGRIFDEAEDKENLQSDQDKALDDIIGEFEAGEENVTYRATVNRVPDGYKKGGKEEWCLDVDSAEIAGIRLKLRDEFGPGIYRIRVWRNNKQVRQFDYHIAKPNIARPVAATGDNVAIQSLSEQIRTLTENQNRLMERLLNNPQSNNNNDRFQDLERMSTIIKNLQPPPIANSNSGFGMKEGMELFTKGMELAENMRSDGSDTWISVIKEMVKGLPITDLLENLAKAKQNPQMQRRQLQAPQNQNLNGHSPIMNASPVNNSPAATGEQLQQSVIYLIGKAQRNSDPGLYAEWLLDNADQQLIRQMANDPNVIQQLAVIFPRLNDPVINAWFVELVQEVKGILAQMQNRDNDGAGIGPHNEENPHVAGAASFGAPDARRYPGDQDHPQNHAIPGETGAA